MMRLATVVCACLCFGACSKSNDASKADPAAAAKQIEIAKLLTKKIAYEGYPIWAMQHPDKACPDKLDDLLPGIPSKDLNGGKDPWGHAYVTYCGPTLPPGAKGFAAMSFGPDGKEATADDIKSWE